MLDTSTVQKVIYFLYIYIYIYSVSHVKSDYLCEMIGSEDALPTGRTHGEFKVFRIISHETVEAFVMQRMTYREHICCYYHNVHTYIAEF